MAKRPNIVFFVADEYRGDVLGHLGNPAAATPRADALAKQAVSFSHAYCQTPECVPSRCSFLTGWYPHVRGHRSMSMRLRPDDPVLSRRLKDVGYFTWWGGGRDTDAADFAFGADAFCDVYYDGKKDADLELIAKFSPQDTSLHVGAMSDQAERQMPDWHATHAAARQILNAPTDRPFFLHLDLAAPHPAYRVGKSYRDRIDPSKLPPRRPTPTSWEGVPSRYRLTWETNTLLQGWSERQFDELRTTYYAMCSRVDEQLGMIIDALRQAGVYENTAIFFFADHGDFTGDYGLVDKFENTFPEPLVRVPLIIKPPADRKLAPRVSDALVELIDVPATVEELTALQPECTTFGRSLLSLIAGETDEHRPCVFSQGGGTNAELTARLLGTGGEHKYLPQAKGYPKMIAYTRPGPEYGKAIMCRTRRYKYVRRLYESDELYDLSDDSAECSNRVDDPAFGAVLAQMKDRVLNFYLETSDVLMRGRGNSGAWPPADASIRPGAGPYN